MELRPYQTEVLTAISEARDAGHSRQLIVLPTGTGKTVIFARLMADTPGRRLCLVHRDELVRQTVRQLRDAGLDSVGVIKAADNDVTSDVIVASVQTLCRDKRLAAYVRHGKADLIVVDEAHHAPAPSYRKILDGALAPGGLLVGVTATPDRQTAHEVILPNRRVISIRTAGMRRVFDHLTYARQLTDMIAEGWLVDVVPVTIDTDADMSSVRTVAGDWSADELGDALESSDAYEAILQAWQTHASDRPTIVFLPTVQTSKDMAETFARANIPVAHIDGNTPVEDRQLAYKKLRSGDIRVITNCMVLTEGFDEPSVSCIVVARPTQTRSLFAQMIGRGTRLYPGKADCLVMSVVAHSLDIPPVTLQAFLQDVGWEDGTPVSKRQKAIVEAAEAFESVKVQQALQFINRFKDSPSANTKLIWRKLATRWVLVAGDVTITLEPSFNDHWLPKANDVILSDPLPLEGATSVAEHYAMRSGQAILADPTAKWRTNPPTEAQLRFALALGLPHNIAETLDRGSISEYITTAKLENKPTRRLNREDYDLIRKLLAR